MDMFPSSTGGQNGDGNVAATNTGQIIDLRDKIDSAACYARNEAPNFPMSNLFIGDSSLGCKSDTDEQLILHIAFHEFVKVCVVCDARAIASSHFLFPTIPFFAFHKNKNTDSKH